MTWQIEVLVTFPSNCWWQVNRWVSDKSIKVHLLRINLGVRLFVTERWRQRRRRQWRRRQRRRRQRRRRRRENVEGSYGRSIHAGTRAPDLQGFGEEGNWRRQVTAEPLEIRTQVKWRTILTEFKHQMRSGNLFLEFFFWMVAQVAWFCDLDAILFKICLF